MYFARAFTSLLVTAGVAASAVLPHQLNSTALSNVTTPSLNSDTFVIRAQEFTNTSKTLGWLHAEYAYPPGYYATLHTNRDDAIEGHLTDTTNASNSSLVFPESGGYEQGFVLESLGSAMNASIAMIYSGRSGTKGIFVNEGGIVDWAGQRVAWYGEYMSMLSFVRSIEADFRVACEQALEWGSATAVWYKLYNVTTPRNCVDIQLIAEYVSSS